MTLMEERQKNEEKKTKLVGVQDPKIETKRIFLFLFVTFAIGWIAELAFIRPMYTSGDVQIVTQAVEMIASIMFAPAFGALASRIMTKEGLLHSGFQFNIAQHKFCFLFGWFGMTALTFLGAILYFIIFRENYDPMMTKFVESAVSQGAAPDSVDIIASYKTTLLMNVFSAPLLDIINAFGEEWGWRGYFLPKLYRKFGTIPAVLISGFTAGLWYAPLVALGYYYGVGYAGFPFGGIAAMCVFGMVTGSIYAFISLRSGSIFPAVFAHSAINVMMSQAANFTVDGGNYFVGPAPTGIVAGIPLMIAAVIFLLHLVKYPVVSSEADSSAEK